MFTSIKSYEKWFLIKNGKLERILESGNYIFPTFYNKSLEIYDSLANCGLFKHPRILWYYKENPELIKKHFHIIPLTIYQACIVYQNELPVDLLDWGNTYFYFKWNCDFATQIIDYSKNPLIPKEKYSDLKSLSGSNTSKHLSILTVHEWEQAALIINGVFTSMLKSGEYMFINKLDSIWYESFSTKITKTEISGQEILSKDRYTLRINAILYYTIKNGEIYFTKTKDPDAYIYNEAQFALRELIGNENLSEILEKKETLSQILKESVVSILSEIGVEVNSFGIKDIILPWDMKDIINKLIIAEKDAQVNAIKRKDESANVRDMLNHAKLYQEHPMLFKLKELETLEKVVAKVDVLQINNGFSGLLDMVQLTPSCKKISSQ